MNWKSRKFLLAVGSLGCGFVLALIGKLSAEFAGLASTVMVSYATANSYTTGKGAEAPKVDE